MRAQPVSQMHVVVFCAPGDFNDTMVGWGRAKEDGPKIEGEKGRRLKWSVPDLQSGHGNWIVLSQA